MHTIGNLELRKLDFYRKLARLLFLPSHVLTSFELTSLLQIITEVITDRFAYYFTVFSYVIGRIIMPISELPLTDRKSQTTASYTFC